MVEIVVNQEAPAYTQAFRVAIELSEALPGYGRFLADSHGLNYDPWIHSDRQVRLVAQAAAVAL